MIAITTALKKIASVSEKIVVIQGGARAGKTMAVMLLLIDYALKNSGSRIAVVSHSYPHLQRGAISDALTIAKEMQLKFMYNKNDKKLMFHNWSDIFFITADKVEDFKGTQFHISFINECNYVKQDVFNQIMLRTVYKLFIDFNPVQRFYIFDLLKLRDDAKLIKLTYKDNEALDASLVEELERIKMLENTSSYWANYVKVYIYGEIGSSIDAVFPDWKAIKEVPSTAKLVSVGVDFGFVNDVTAIVAIYYNDGNYIVDELAYSTKLLTNKIAEIIDKLPVVVPVYCDNAEPRTIAELNNQLKRFRFIGVKFGVIESIDIVAKQNIYITERSTNIQNEQLNYVYMRDKYTNELTNVPIDSNNHAIDAIRYGICGYLFKKYSGVYQNYY